MKDFEKMFAKAVNLLLTEKKDEKDEKDEKEKKKSAIVMIPWSPGSGAFSDIIRGLKSDAGYSEVIGNTNATSNPAGLMSKLGISKASTSKSNVESANEILAQTIAANEIMSVTYGKPKIQKNFIVIPIIVDDDEITTRNATVFIHLTLIGAYNSGLLKIDTPLRFPKIDKESRYVVIASS